MRIWHWKSHRKVHPNWKTSETTLKCLTKDNHTEIFLPLLYKNVNLLLSHWKISTLLISFVLAIFSVQCDFHILVVIHVLVEAFWSLDLLLFINEGAINVCLSDQKGSCHAQAAAEDYYLRKRDLRIETKQKAESPCPIFSHFLILLNKITQNQYNSC